MVAPLPPDQRVSQNRGIFYGLTNVYVSSTVRTTSSIHLRSAAVSETNRSTFGSGKSKVMFSIYGLIISRTFWLRDERVMTHVDKQIIGTFLLLRDDLIGCSRKP